MERNFIDYKEMMQDAQRELEHEQERLTEKMDRVNGFMQTMAAMNEMLVKYGKALDEIEQLQQQLADEKRQRAELEMKMNEMSKLSAGVAKKSSEEDLLKALRTYVNRSKRKTTDKRVFAKTATLEIANANGLLLPEDLAALIDSLDDEQAEPKVVNVAGSYNDIHDNGSVNLSNRQ